MTAQLVAVMALYETAVEELEALAKKPSITDEELLAAITKVKKLRNRAKLIMETRS